MSSYQSETAIVENGALIGEGTQIWNNAQIRTNASIGKNCIVGKDAYIGSGVLVGDNCKIQNSALLYEPAKIDSGVFIGPGAILTNDEYPRAVTPSGELKSGRDWKPVGVEINIGASIGAGAICVAPVIIGAWAVVGAGAVVTKNVPSFALVVGTPARQIGWVGKAGHKLSKVGDHWVCPETNQRYHLASDSTLEEV
jgi:acetyltransferase-like isoleucine patch superfamily enzyme